jgi:hypothetical protein
MWWIAFTAIDLYIGLVVLKSMQPSLSLEKQKRIAVIEKFIIASLVLCVIAFAFKWWHQP